MELLLLTLLLLPFTFLPVETVSEWKPLENAPEDFTLSLSLLSWCGESRTFMNRFRELVSNEPSLETLQLRYVDAKTSPASQNIIIYHKGGAYSYSGTFSPAYVLASLLHLLSTDPEDRPFHSLHSAEELQDFISATDTAVVLADFCGWTLGSREEETVESNETELFSSFQVKEAYDVANQTRSQCSSTERVRFEAFYRNLTELANLNVLTPFHGRFGVLTSVQVLEDAGIVVPPEEPWLLLARSQEPIPSWRTLDDPSRLNEFFTDFPSVVHELIRDSELPSDRPSMLVFLQRGHCLRKKHDESLHALSVFREVARYFWSSKLPGNVKSNESRSVKETVKTVYVQTLGKELDGLGEQLTDSVENLLHLFLQDEGNVSRQGDRNSTGVSSLTEVLGSNRKRSVYFGLYDGEDALQESFTGKSGAGPSVVAFFPDRELYYVYPDGAPVSFSPLVEFLEEALAGSLKPFVRSGPAPATPREGVMPPFVNLDFRPVQPVPHVTVESFSELVLGTRKSMEVNESYESVVNAAWETNTLVIFTQPWCGFCKRMELVVREVYRSLNLASFPKEPKRPGFETPAFYQMDCTENHCSGILGNILKVEEYPTVVLFPAQRKMQPVVFRDSPTVENIFRFIRTSMNRGSFHGLHEGFLPSTIRIEGEEQAESKQTKTRFAEQAGESSVTVGVGTVLLASDKLSNASSVFEKAAVLIISVTADHVMGLIINKPVQWTQLSSLDSSQLETVTTAYLGFGGPIYDHPKHFFTCTRLQGMEGFTELTDGLYVAGPSPTERVFDLIEAHKLSPSDFRFYVGHCGWSVVQLQNELLTGYWDVTESHADTLGWEPESSSP